MDAKELRGRLEKRLAGSLSGDYSDQGLTKAGGGAAFYSWWHDCHLDNEQREALAQSNHTYLTEAMLELSDEELMFLWAVYLM
jgi:hypothetical protein